MNETQLIIQQTARNFAENELKPRAREIDENDHFARDLYLRMAELGLLGMTVSSDHGGSDADTVSWAIALEEMSRGCAAVADMQGLCKLMCDLIEQNATPEQQQQLLPALVSGEKICVIAQTEPGAGSDVASVRTVARQQPNGNYLLNGTKHFITAGAICDWAVVVATTDPALGRDGISLFLVDRETEGFTVGQKTRLLGMRGLATSELVFENCEIPESAMLAPPGAGFRKALGSLNAGRISIGAQAVGIAQAAFEESLDYARVRQTFKQPIAKHQAVQFKLADMSMRIEAARLMLRKAAYLHDMTRPIIREASEAKLFASEVLQYVTDEAVQIHGAIGYSAESTVERLYRDARVYRIWEGTSEIQRMIIGRQLIA
ncbi:acyl-CoA dehydrogenase family protein [Pseudorhizobium halotolerans]|uniref:acyl-CoA dehydrogenase family protein n=1 Tax=Pseudorhizobium halotolerans TaxID=1233081 RepID=UPI00161F5149|nr:acyl-CoA dehydrogenase family protein [Pseudorhizobium halotolerans]